MLLPCPPRSPALRVDDSLSPLDSSAPPLGEQLSATAPPVALSGLNARRAIALLSVYVLAQVAIALVFGVAVAIYYLISAPHLAPARLAKQLQTTPVLLSAGTLGILGGAFLVVLMTRWFYRGTPRNEAYQDLGLTRGSTQNFVVAAILGLSLAGLYVWLAIKFVSAGHTPPMGLFGRAAMASGFPRVLLAILAVLIAPPVEEFLFRGAMFAGFKRSWGQSTAILLVTVTFVLLHAPRIS